MPEKTSPGVVAKIIDLRKGGASWPEVVKETGLATSTVQRFFYKGADKKAKEKASGMHKLTPAEIKKVVKLTEQGLSGRQITEKTGITTYNVYQARHRFGTEGPNSKFVSNKADSLKRNKKILKLRDDGLTATQIAKKTGVSVATIYAVFRRSPAHSNKGEMNGNYNHSPDSGSAAASANAQVLTGFAWSETLRFITNLSERIKVPPDKLRRRLSELLADTSLG